MSFTYQFGDNILLPLILFAPSAKALQRLLKSCSTYANEYDIIFNSLTTVCMFFFCPYTYRNLNVRKFTPDRIEQEFSEEVTYIGQVIQNSLKDDLDLRKKLKKFKTSGNFLLRKFTACSKEVKCIVFHARCSFVYCGYLWSEFNARSLRKLRVYLNEIFRRLIGGPRWSRATALLANVHWDNLDVILQKLSYRFKSRIRNSKSCIMKTI